MAKELEIKLALNDMPSAQVLACLNDVLERFGIGDELRFKEGVLINEYFDTPDFDLNQKKMALRIRDIEGQYIQTLKTKGQSHNGLSERGEWEWKLNEKKLDGALLQALDVWPKDLDPHMLSKVFETNFQRFKADVRFEGAVIELAFDSGQVLSAGRSEVIHELELELKNGELDSLKKLGENLIHNLGAAPSDISKAERGYRLYRAGI